MFRKSATFEESVSIPCGLFNSNVPLTLNSNNFKIFFSVSGKDIL